MSVKSNRKSNRPTTAKTTAVVELSDAELMEITGGVGTAGLLKPEGVWGESTDTRADEAGPPTVVVDNNPEDSSQGLTVTLTVGNGTANV